MCVLSIAVTGTRRPPIPGEVVRALTAQTRESGGQTRLLRIEPVASL